jgi:hypothetical protein
VNFERQRERERERVPVGQQTCTILVIVDDEVGIVSVSVCVRREVVLFV